MLPNATFCKHFTLMRILRVGTQISYWTLFVSHQRRQLSCRIVQILYFGSDVVGGNFFTCVQYLISTPVAQFETKRQKQGRPSLTFPDPDPIHQRAAFWERLYADQKLPEILKELYTFDNVALDDERELHKIHDSLPIAPESSPGEPDISPSPPRTGDSAESEPGE